jgi:hypothetical protein
MKGLLQTAGGDSHADDHPRIEADLQSGLDLQ